MLTFYEQKTKMEEDGEEFVELDIHAYHYHRESQEEEEEELELEFPSPPDPAPGGVRGSQLPVFRVDPPADPNHISNVRKRFKRNIHDLWVDMARMERDEDQRYQWQVEGSGDERIRISSMITPGEAGGNHQYWFRVEAELDCDAERVYRMNHDTSYITRRQWEPGNDLGYIQEHLDFETGTDAGSLRVMEFWVRVPRWLNMLGVYHRHFAGIQYRRWDQANNSYTVIFQSRPYVELQTCGDIQLPAGCVQAHSTSKLWLKQVETPDRPGKLCRLILLISIRPGGWIPASAFTWYAGKLRERIAFYEEFARDDRLYCSIYNQGWVCDQCGGLQPCTAAECRHCHRHPVSWNPTIPLRECTTGTFVHLVPEWFTREQCFLCKSC